MPPIPTGDLRSNRGTWSVPSDRLPAVARDMTTLLPAEAFDPTFRGQDLETTYFDTRRFRLRKVRRRGDRYLVLRLRCYQPSDTYALSAKTETQKFRTTIEESVARVLLEQGFLPDFYDLLPADLVARVVEFTDRPLVPVVCVAFRRYAVENASDRLTLDVDVRTDTGRRYPSHVLEHKSTRPSAETPIAVHTLRPLKLSKFLWSLS
jgi:hypothetical protein